MVAVRVLVDVWSFELCWKAEFPRDRSERESAVPVDWRQLQTALWGELPKALGGDPRLPVFKGISVYAPGGADNAKPGTLRPAAIGAVDHNAGLRLVTDLFTGAIYGTYDVALLISDDPGLCPAVQAIQDRLGKRIIHVGFRRGGDEIRLACWGHILLDGAVAESIRAKG